MIAVRRAGRSLPRRAFLFRQVWASIQIRKLPASGLLTGFGLLQLQRRLSCRLLRHSNVEIIYTFKVDTSAPRFKPLTSLNIFRLA
jgi:hypothetical protein